MNCHPSQTNGSAINHLGAAAFQRATAIPTTPTSTNSPYAQPIGHGYPSRKSHHPSGAVTHFSVMGGFPNFSSVNPRNAPNTPAKMDGNNCSVRVPAGCGFGFMGEAGVRTFVAAL
jgi:hypothetical protein